LIGVLFGTVGLKQSFLICELFGGLNRALGKGPWSGLKGLLNGHEETTVRDPRMIVIAYLEWPSGPQEAKRVLWVVLQAPQEFPRVPDQLWRSPEKPHVFTSGPESGLERP